MHRSRDAGRNELGDHSSPLGDPWRSKFSNRTMHVFRNKQDFVIAVVLGPLLLVAIFVIGSRLYLANRTPVWIETMLRDPNPDARRMAAIWLHELGLRNTDVYNALLRAIRDDSPGVRRQAAYDLGEFGPEAVDAIPLLREALSDQDEHVRRNAAMSLRKIGYQQTTTPTTR